MAAFPGGGFPAQSPGGLTDFQQSSMEQRQAAIQRLGAQAFQQSWYLRPLPRSSQLTYTVYLKQSCRDVEVPYLVAFRN